MPKPSVVIELSPSRLEVAVVRGRAIVDRRVSRHSLPAFAENWRAALETLRPRLVDMVRELGAVGARATLLYTGPTAATGLFSCPRSAGRAQGRRAARLALAEAAGFALDDHPHELDARWADRGATAAGPAQIHFLGAAEKDEAAQALADWLKAAGLNPQSLLPLDAATVVGAVERAASAMADDGVTIILYAGEHGSALAATAGGRLRFVRQIAIGCEQLVEALALRQTGADGAAATVAARDLLARIGIPARDQANGAAAGQDASTMLPALQPTIQRWVLEIRQSLRFGLDEGERSGAKLAGLGPAARIPRLLDVIAEQAGLRLGESPKQAPQSAIDDWVAGKPTEVNLLPHSITSDQMARRVIRGIWVGTAAAGALLAADAGFTTVELRSHERNLETLTARLGEARPAMDMTTRLVTTQNALAGARQRISARLGNVAEWDAALVMLANTTPDTIKLSDVRFSIVGSQPTCQILGRAPLSAGEPLKAYLDALRSVPIVSVCRLGATQRSESLAGPVQLFEITLSLVDLPQEGFGLGRLVTSVPADREGP